MRTCSFTYARARVPGTLVLFHFICKGYLHNQIQIICICVCIIIAQAGLAGHSRQGTTLLQQIVKTALMLMSSHNTSIVSRRPSPHYDTLASILTLLGNCAWSSECRGTLKKVYMYTIYTIWYLV